MTHRMQQHDQQNVISALKSRLAEFRDRRIRLTESDTVRVLVMPVLGWLGWDLQDVEEVRSEYRHASADNPVDYALFLRGSPVLFVEAKALGVSLDDRKPLLQTLNYANTAGVDWCVLTNGAEWRIYKVHAPVAAEEKLFLTVHLEESGGEPGAVASTLHLLSKERMRARAIDALWSEWRVDRAVERVLDSLTEEDAFIRLIAKRADGLTHGDVRASLKRSGLRSFYPKVDAYMTRLDGKPSPIVPTAPTTPPTSSALPERSQAPGLPAPPPTPAPDVAVEPAPPPMAESGRARLMRTSEMVERGLLPVGTCLCIKDRPDSTATVVDGRRVEFRGDVMSFNEWGCRVTGWTSIQIYKWALLPDGRLLEALREGD
jgi:predicted type IV restriction endonuclease